MKDNNRYLLAAVWFVCGILTWKIAAYTFGNVTSHLIFPNNILHIYYKPAFVVYTITDLIITFLVAFLLSMATGKKNIFTLTYIVGAVGLPLYSAIRSHLQALHHSLPVLNTLIPSLTVLLIITPLIAWAGATLGNKNRREKTA
jgi:ABC-type transport system involved in cytochrome c biogenesis permease component